MGKEYVIIWDFVDNNGVVHPQNKQSFFDKEEANSMWLKMKKNTSFANMRHETIVVDGFQTVTVHFQGNTRSYLYLCDKEDYKEEQPLIVPAGADNKLSVAFAIICEKKTKEDIEAQAKCSFSQVKKVLGEAKLYKVS